VQSLALSAGKASELLGLHVEIFVVFGVESERLKLWREHFVSEEADGCALVFEAVELVEVVDVEGFLFKIEFVWNLGGDVVELGQVGCHINKF